MNNNEFMKVRWNNLRMNVGCGVRNRKVPADMEIIVLSMWGNSISNPRPLLQAKERCLSSV